jgi:hypothetical protein
MRERTFVLKKPARPPRTKINLQPLILPAPDELPQEPGKRSRPIELIDESVNPFKSHWRKQRPPFRILTLIFKTLCYAALLGAIGLITLAILAPPLGC